MCNNWKALEKNTSLPVSMDLCQLHACICDDQGHLVQLNMRSEWLGVRGNCPDAGRFGSCYCTRPPTLPVGAPAGYKMTCSFPGDALSKFTSLTAAYLGENDFTGTFESVAASLAALKHLRELNLEGSKGIGGAFGADDSSGACLLAKVSRRRLALPRAAQ